MQPGEFLLSISVAALYLNAVRVRVSADLPLSYLLPHCGYIDKGNGTTGKSSPLAVWRQWRCPVVTWWWRGVQQGSHCSR
jgi:hypothetical protein